MTLPRLLRYFGASAVATAIGQSVLISLVATGATTPGWANVIATAAGTLPSFELNRRWVWGRSGPRSWAGEVLPFCVWSFLALAVSTVAVRTAVSMAVDAGMHGLGQAAAAVVASLSAGGLMWVLQYIILDRVLFRPSGLDRLEVVLGLGLVPSQPGLDLAGQLAHPADGPVDHGREPLPVVLDRGVKLR